MFYPPNLIDRELDKIFLKIKSEAMLKEKSEDKVFDNLAYVMAELNIIHPFREGNGRTIREFIRLMAKRCGYSLNWGNVDSDKLLNASILSVDDYAVLINILKICTERDKI
jgi:cell filamentation protein